MLYVAKRLTQAPKVFCNISNMEKRKSISPLKVYSFPEQLHIESILGLYVIVSPLTANWIVLENEEQIDFFKLLQTNNLETALKSLKATKRMHIP